VLGLLLWALAQAGVRSWKVAGDAGAASRAAFMMVLMIGVHSLFEYPLWYAYFLLPTAWAWGYALRRPAAGEQPVAAEAESVGNGGGWPLRIAGGLMIAGSVFALIDYGKVVVIYAPADDAGPLAERIERGQGSVFFSHHADYAAATTTEPPSRAMAAFDTTTHSLLDSRLMMAWPPRRRIGPPRQGELPRRAAARVSQPRRNRILRGLFRPGSPGRDTAAVSVRSAAARPDLARFPPQGGVSVEGGGVTPHLVRRAPQRPWRP
jgi:hypothetical protein